MELVEVLQCGCNPNKTYASRSSFRNHFSSNRHRAWVADQKSGHMEKTEVCIDVVRRQLEKCELERAFLTKRVAELEQAVFETPARRAVTDTKKKKIAALQKWKCKICRNVLSHVFEVDHAKPLFMGGGNQEDNLQALCRECHGKKTSVDRETYMAGRRRAIC